MGYLQDIKEVMRDFRGNYSKMLSPKKMCEASIRLAKKRAVTWGVDKRSEVPNRFIIEVSFDDWAEYYGIRTKEVCSRVEDILDNEFRGGDYFMMGKPFVILAKNGDLARGDVSITVGFAKSSYECTNSETIRYDDVSERDEINWSGKVTLHYEEIREPEEADWHEKKTEHMTDCGSGGVSLQDGPNDGPWLIPDETPVYEQPEVEAYLEGDSGRYGVTHGSSIGVFRREDKERPSIELPPEDFPYCSQIQGLFLRRNDGWQFVSKSNTNDTEVISISGEREILSKERSCIIDAGYKLLIGDSSLIFMPLP